MRSLCRMDIRNESSNKKRQQHMFVPSLSAYKTKTARQARWNLRNRKLCYIVWLKSEFYLGRATSSRKATKTLSYPRFLIKKKCTCNLSRWLPDLGFLSSSGKITTNQDHKSLEGEPVLLYCSWLVRPQKPWRLKQGDQLPALIECSGPQICYNAILVCCQHSGCNTMQNV